MPSNKAKHRAQPQQHQSAPQPSDYETDAAPQMVLPQHAPPQRSNEEMNLSVIRRHYPAVTNILHVTPYAGLYEFKMEAETWEKLDIDGTLFVCSLTPSPIGADRFAVIILNRRGMTNFFAELKDDEDIEFKKPFVILPEEKVHGLWIHSEDPPSSTAMAPEEAATRIKAAAKQAAKSRFELETQAQAQNGTQIAPESAQGGVAMGRQLSLRELFGQQRNQDAGFSVHNHNSTPIAAGLPQPSGAQHDVLGQLFARAKQDYNSVS